MIDAKGPRRRIADTPAYLTVCESEPAQESAVVSLLTTLGQQALEKVQEAQQAPDAFDLLPAIEENLHEIVAELSKSTAATQRVHDLAKALGPFASVIRRVI